MLSGTQARRGPLRVEVFLSIRVDVYINGELLLVVGVVQTTIAELVAARLLAAIRRLERELEELRNLSWSKSRGGKGQARPATREQQPQSTPCASPLNNWT